MTQSSFFKAWGASIKVIAPVLVGLVLASVSSDSFAGPLSALAQAAKRIEDAAERAARKDPQIERRADESREERDSGDGQFVVGGGEGRRLVGFWRCDSSDGETIWRSLENYAAEGRAIARLRGWSKDNLELQIDATVESRYQLDGKLLTHTDPDATVKVHRLNLGDEIDLRVFEAQVQAETRADDTVIALEWTGPNTYFVPPTSPDESAEVCSRVEPLRFDDGQPNRLEPQLYSLPAAEAPDWLLALAPSAAPPERIPFMGLENSSAHDAYRVAVGVLFARTETGEPLLVASPHSAWYAALLQRLANGFGSESLESFVLSIAANERDRFGYKAASRVLEAAVSVLSGDAKDRARCDLVIDLAVRARNSGPRSSNRLYARAAEIAALVEPESLLDAVIPAFTRSALEAQCAVGRCDQQSDVRDPEHATRKVIN